MQDKLVTVTLAELLQVSEPRVMVYYRSNMIRISNNSSNEQNHHLPLLTIKPKTLNFAISASIFITGLILSPFSLLLLRAPSVEIAYAQSTNITNTTPSPPPSIPTDLGKAVFSAAIAASVKSEAAFAAANAAEAAAAGGGSIADIATTAASTIISHGGNNAAAASTASAAAASAAGAKPEAAAAAASAAAAGKPPSDISSAAGGGAAGVAAATAAVQAATMSSAAKPTAASNIPQNNLKQSAPSNNTSQIEPPILSATHPTPPPSSPSIQTSPSPAITLRSPTPPASQPISNQTVSSPSSSSSPPLEQEIPPSPISQSPLPNQTAVQQQQQQEGQPPSSSAVPGLLFPQEQEQQAQQQEQQQPMQPAPIEPPVAAPAKGLTANGTIGSLIFAPGNKWLTSGDWTLILRNGNVSSFSTNMTWYNENGTSTHTHELLNLRPNGGAGSITATPDDIIIKGLMDVGTNHRIVWTNVHSTIDIKGGKTISISLADKDTNKHFAGQAIYGVVKSFTMCSDEPGPNMEVLEPCTAS